MALLGNVALTGRDMAVDHAQHVSKGLGHLAVLHQAGGSTQNGLSATDAWRRAVAGGGMRMRLARTNSESFS
jgi:hypothetical protein